MIDKTAGKVTYAVMSFGGFLGIGDRYHPLPWDVLTYDTGQGGYMVDLDRSMLEAAPTYASSETPNLERSPLEPGCIPLLRRASLLGLGGAEARSAGRGRSGDIVDTNQSHHPDLDRSQCFDQTRLGRRHQLREHRDVMAAGGAKRECGAHLDADHVPARRKAQLALTGEEHVPRLVLLPADQGVRAVGAEPSVGSRFTSGAGEVVVAAGSAVFGPSTRLEVPAAEGPDPFFAAFSNTWRSVNSWRSARRPGRAPSPR